jgi:DDE domain
LVEAIAGHDRAAAVAQQFGVTDWSSRHNSDAFQLRPGEQIPLGERTAPRETIGIPVTAGMDEVALALTAGAYSHTGKAQAVAMSSSDGPVATKHGLLVVPETAPSVIITDQLKSYGAAKRELLPGVEHRQHRYLNNRAENSHQPTHKRERRMQGFKSPGQAHRFLATHGPLAQHFRPRRHRLSAPAYRQVMAQRFQIWHEVTGTVAA